MIIANVLNWVGGQVIRAAMKSEDNPKAANALTALLGSVGTLWLSDSTRTAVADALTVIADVLRGL